jgi:aldose 1-epimerase
MPSASTVSITSAEKLSDGREVAEYQLTNDGGTAASILTLGATMRTCLVADALGTYEDVVLGFDTAEEYLRGSDYFGATIGRYANRIANGRFTVGGKSCQLDINNAPHAEHGGEDGFHRRIWHVDGTDTANGAALRLSLVSPDGDQGYPGELTVRLTYTLTDDDELRIDYRATASAATVVNLTNHTYWTLAGAGDALNARLSVQADAYTPVDASLIPTGEIRSVAGTAFDFRTPQAIASRIRDGSDSQLRFGRGYDHNFVLRGQAGALAMAARLEDPRSGRVLEVLTTEPGLHVYSGNFLSGAVVGKRGRLHRQGDGISLETQHFPDSPNHPQFPSTILQPDAVWSSTTVYRFRTMSR